jgi:hypothetical protein
MLGYRAALSILRQERTASERIHVAAQMAAQIAIGIGLFMLLLYMNQPVLSRGRLVLEAAVLSLFLCNRQPIPGRREKALACLGACLKSSNKNGN